MIIKIRIRVSNVLSHRQHDVYDFTVHRNTTITIITEYGSAEI